MVLFETYKKKYEKNFTSFQFLLLLFIFFHYVSYMTILKALVGVYYNGPKFKYQL